LMPMTDFRAQVAGNPMSLDLLKHCADRYDVSFTAAALKWLEFTEARAALVYARDGFVLWGRRSDAAKKSGVFYPSGLPLPPESIAARGQSFAIADPKGVELAPGVWRRFEPVREMTIFADRYDATISLLILPQTSAFKVEWADEPVEDLVSRIEAASERG